MEGAICYYPDDNSNIINNNNNDDQDVNNDDDDEEIIVVCSPTRKNEIFKASPARIDETPEKSDESQDVACPNNNNINNDNSFKSDDDDDGERNVQVQELAVVTDKPNHDQAQQLNDFDSAKAVNPHILQTNSNTSNTNNNSSSNIHSNNNSINENNDATATSAIYNENSSNDISTNATAESIELLDSASAQIDKHNTANNNNIKINSYVSGATTTAENIEYTTVATTDHLGTTLTVQGVEQEQTENFVVTSGYIQESKYHKLIYSYSNQGQ